MRPPSVYAKPSCPAADPCDLLRLLHGPHRLACRLLMVLLSQQGWTAAQISDLLGYDPGTVRRWIHRYQRHGASALADRPRAGRPRLGSPTLAQRILRLLQQPGAWTIPRLWQRLGRPAISLRTLHRRVAEVAAWRRPRLGPGPRRPAPPPPWPARRCGGAGRGRDPRQPAALGPRDLDPPGAAPAGHDPWEEPAPDHLRRGRPAKRPLLLPGHPQGRQRQLHRLLRAAAGRLPGRAAGRGGLRQRHHPPLQGRRAVAGRPPADAGAARGALQPPRQPGRADLGRAQGTAGERPDPDHPRARPPGARLLPPAHHRADAGDRRAAQLALAARGLRAELQGGRLEPSVRDVLPGRVRELAEADASSAAATRGARPGADEQAPRAQDDPGSPQAPPP